MKLTSTSKIRLSVLGILILAVLAGFLVYPVLFNKPVDLLNAKAGLKVPHYWNVPFKLGLDLQGGAQLIYQADLSNIPEKDKGEALAGARDVIERRVNAFGIAEPVVQTSASGGNSKIMVELAGVQDINQAIKMIGETPLLEFKDGGEPKKLTDAEIIELAKANEEVKKKAEGILKEVLASSLTKFADLAKKYSEDTSAANGGDLGWVKSGAFVPEFNAALFDQLKKGEVTKELVKSDFGYHIIYKEDERGSGADLEIKSRHILLKTKSAENVGAGQVEWKYTGLTGKELKKASVEFDPNTSAPNVALEFNEAGKELFAQITRRNVGKPVAIFLDGAPITTPRVNEEITGGKAIITGDYSLEEARTLARNLNAGALPVPVSLVSQQTVGATLGADSIAKSLFAGLVGLVAVILFMILFYRLPGLVAAVSLVIYGILVLCIFKIFGVTLSLAGIAGFILSLGIAVDANVLIFARMKEEFAAGRGLASAIDEGFKRAWPSIRDGNTSTLITCVILFWFTTSLVKGFALTLTIGILTSMFTAVVMTRGFLKVVAGPKTENWHFLFNRSKKSAENK